MESGGPFLGDKIVELVQDKGRCELGRPLLICTHKPPPTTFVLLILHPCANPFHSWDYVCETYSEGPMGGYWELRGLWGENCIVILICHTVRHFWKSWNVLQNWAYSQQICCHLFLCWENDDVSGEFWEDHASLIFYLLKEGLLPLDRHKGFILWKI